MRVAMFGGTFDPVHIGHLIGAQFAVQEMDLDQVLFVPAATPPHKVHREICPAHHRVAMLSEAVASNPRFALCMDEIDRGGSSYTMDTVRRFRESLVSGKDELFFLVGGDNVAELDTWKHWDSLRREVKFIAMAREGFDKDSPKVRRMHDQAEIHWVDMPIIGISSTAVRERAAGGKSLRYLVPDRVAGYIEAHGLYRGGG